MQGGSRSPGEKQSKVGPGVTGIRGWVCSPRTPEARAAGPEWARARAPQEANPAAAPAPSRASCRSFTCITVSLSPHPNPCPQVSTIIVP